MNTNSDNTTKQPGLPPRSRAAVILTGPSSHERQPAPELALVGTLPVLQRAILSAHSAKFDRVFVLRIRRGA